MHISNSPSPRLRPLQPLENISKTGQVDSFLLEDNLPPNPEHQTLSDGFLGCVQPRNVSYQERSFLRASAPSLPPQHTRFPTFAECQIAVERQLRGDETTSRAGRIVENLEYSLTKAHHLPFFLLLGQASLRCVAELDAGQNLGFFAFDDFYTEGDFTSLCLRAERRYRFFCACGSFSQFLEDVQDPKQRPMLLQEYGAETLSRSTGLALEGLFDALLGLSSLTLRTAMCASGSAASTVLQSDKSRSSASHQKCLATHLEKAQADPLFAAIAEACAPYNEPAAKNDRGQAQFWACWAIDQSKRDATVREVERARTLVLHPDSPFADTKSFEI